MQTEAARQRAIQTHRFMVRLSRNWLKILLVILGLYVALPFAAPTLMHLGASGPAQLLYTIYSPMCHQFAFRSWFLFGEQTAYPRAASGTDLTPFEVYASQDPTFQRVPDLYAWTDDLLVLSREFVGNERMGYKVALCERDIAIYGTIFLAGLLFVPVRGRLRPVPIWLYLLLGLVPIGLDGFSQLLSNPPFALWPLRESTPFFRTLTGALFGLMNAWLALPHLEQSMRETREEIQARLRRAGVLESAS